MVNVRFPKTNVVGCVFCYRQVSSADCKVYDDYDRRLGDSKGLKVYYYRVPDYLRDCLAVGDPVLVHCQTGYQMCEVAQIDVLTSMNVDSLAPVVCKLDLASYKAEVEKKRALKVMRDQIEAEKKRLEALVTYDLIAEKNPAFKEMLDSFKAMGGIL